MILRATIKGVFFGLVITVCPLMAQDDATTQHAASGYDGGYITGPASNPLSFLNGPAYRTFGQINSKLLPVPYDVPDFAPATLLNKELPRWISFGWEERLRYEGYHNGGFKLNNDDSYLLLRTRLLVNLKPTAWFKISAQVQDARPFGQKPPLGPPNLNAWDLKQAYAEFGDPEKQWISVRVGRQAINYNNTIIANSEWRNQGSSYDAAVVEPASRSIPVGRVRRIGGDSVWRKASATTRKETTFMAPMAGSTGFFRIQCLSHLFCGACSRAWPSKRTAKIKVRQTE